MTPLEYLPLLTAGLVALMVFFLGAGVLSLRSNAQIRSRLSEYLSTGQGVPVSALELELSESFGKRVVLPLLRKLLAVLAWMWPQNRIEALSRRVVLAGRPGGISTGEFIGMKGWCLLALGGGATALGLLSGAPTTTLTVLLWVLLGLMGFFLPDVWLSRRIRRRQNEILLALPDALDMLVVAMEAGLSFENALLEITAKWRTALSLELLQVQRDVGIGQPRRQALLALNDRTGVPDIAAFVSAVNQAEELGVSIVRVLFVQAEEMRIKRRQRAQEAANKTPIKMLFPMVFLIFPALFAVLLGPAVPELVRVLGGL
jgi:tight adherence protein C